jgi:hypothetical protein
MWQRCTNPNFPGYENYGGRGIKVAPRWKHFEKFVQDMGARPSENFTIERMDNDKGYSPANCKWATRTTQCLNRRKFKNNTSGFTGVVQIKGRFEARMDFEHVRYRIGRFDSAELAFKARNNFERKFFANRDDAVTAISNETVWCSSSTGERGITPHKDGGFVVRATRDGVREYLGYFQTLEEARDARRKFIAL